MLQVFQHLHLQPREQRGTDLSRTLNFYLKFRLLVMDEFKNICPSCSGRVRLWALNGQSAHYRQNLIFSCIALPEISAIFSRKGTNFAGKIRIENAVAATSTLYTSRKSVVHLVCTVYSILVETLWIPLFFTLVKNLVATPPPWQYLHLLRTLVNAV